LFWRLVTVSEAYRRGKNEEDKGGTMFLRGKRRERKGRVLIGRRRTTRPYSPARSQKNDPWESRRKLDQKTKFEMKLLNWTRVTNQKC